MNIKRFLELLFKFNFKDFLWLKLIQWEIPQNLQRPHIQNDLGLHFGKSRRCTFRFYQRKHNAVAKVIHGEGKTFSFYYHYFLLFFYCTSFPYLVSKPGLTEKINLWPPKFGQFFQWCIMTQNVHSILFVDLIPLSSPLSIILPRGQDFNDVIINQWKGRCPCSVGLHSPPPSPPPFLKICSVLYR